MNTVVDKSSRRAAGSSRSVELEHLFAKSFSFSASSRMRLYQRLNRFTERNFDLKRTIESMWNRFERTGDSRRAVFRKIYDQLHEGNKFSVAIAPYIPAPERLMISAGEEAGRIPMGFQQAIFVCDAVRRMKATITKALVYPSVLGLMQIAILVGISLKFIPMMLTMLPLARWPAVSQVMYHISEVVIHGGPWILLGAIVTTTAVVLSLDRWQSPVRRFLDRWIPPYTVYREYQGSTFLISLAALVEAGRPVEAAVRHVSMISSPWLRWHLLRIERALREGTKPGRALNTGLLHKEVVGDIEDYSTAGAFDSALGQIGRDTVEDSIARIDATAKILTTLALFVVAGTILLVYTAMVFLVMEVAKSANIPG